MRWVFQRAGGKKYAAVIWLALLAMLVSFITRLVLVLSFQQGMHAPVKLIAGSFFVGLLFDLIVAGFSVVLLVLQITFTTEFIYSRTGRWITLLFFTVLIGLIFFTHIFPKDFNRDLYKAFVGYVLFRFAVYIYLLTRSYGFRQRWRMVVIRVFVFVSVFLLFFNAISEWFFWDEFSARYNFIAVDYLVYTNEVVGNIRESYPVGTIMASIALLSVWVVFLLRHAVREGVKASFSMGRRLVTVVLFAGILIAAAWTIPSGWKYFSKDNYANELAGNGLYDFVQAFRKNELDFYRYYQTLPDASAFAAVRKELEDPYSRFVNNDIFNLARDVSYPGAEKKMNVVLISVESLSGSFLKAFGNTQGITPCLDSLAEQGLLFTNLYASGTRTVRGLEALSLSIPPLPGQSLVKRPGNENLFSLGSVFKAKGYTTQFIYGGYGYFDNMNYFFSHNGYEVIDRTALKEQDIHYANIWGVADEDLFTLAIRTMDHNYDLHRPFFSQVMTVSNHRPYTYPEGRIDIPPASQTRDGAVKYTDYAIGKFLREAAGRPWFGNTVFIIVADHCASSAGKTDLPVTGYHIPMIIYSPGNITPGRFSALTAQIDIPPIILGMLQFKYRTKFFGHDVLHSASRNSRAFISTYQGLGLLEGDTLVVQKPVKKAEFFKPDFSTGDAEEVPGNGEKLRRAISFYQAAAWLISHKGYGAEQE